MYLLLTRIHFVEWNIKSFPDPTNKTSKKCLLRDLIIKRISLLRRRKLRIGCNVSREKIASVDLH